MGRCATPRAPRPIPLHHRANKAQINPGLYPSLDERRGSGHASETASKSGRPWTFGIAAGFVAGWLVTGPIFAFSDTWQLVMNTISSIVTFLMVFLIQNTQNRDSAALQLKLDELIRATEAKNKLIGIERLSEPELESVREKVEKKETGDRLYDSNSARDSEDQEFKAKR